MFKSIGNFFRSFLIQETLPEGTGVTQGPVNIDQLIKILKVKETAKVDGESEMPRTDETHVDSFQLKVYGFIHNDTSQRKQKIKENILPLDKAISDSDIQPKFEEANNIGTLTDKQIKSIVQEEKNRLVASKDKSQELEEDLITFKTDNNLTHVPDYPESHKMYIAILLIVLLAETILNGIYFSQGSEYGLLGGIIVALGIAVVNLSISFYLGRSTTYKNHIKTRLKSLGYFSVAGILLWVSAYNLMVAHYRQQLDVDINNAGTLAIQVLFQSPFALDKFDYWILFLLGWVFGLIAYTEGYYWDDRYPGYGSLHRRVEDAKKNWHDDQNDTIDRLERKRNENLDQFTKIQSEVRSTFNQLKEVVGQKKTLVENLETNIEQMESSGKILIKEYRQENRKYRKTDPPNYFKEDIDPPPHAKIEVNLEGDIAVISEQKNLMDQFVVRVEQIKNNITDSYTQSINTIANIQLEAND